MTFDSLDALKNYILSRSQVAIKMAQERIFKIIEDFLLQYYEEFEPEVYVRTYQLLCSLVKTDVKQTANGWVAEIYYDLDSLNYAMRIVPSQFSWASPHNTYHRQDWTHENDIAVFKMAAYGSHGGYTSGTAVWDDPMRIIKQEGFNILKQSLINAGIPVR